MRGRIFPRVCVLRTNTYRRGRGNPLRRNPNYATGVFITATAPSTTRRHGKNLIPRGRKRFTVYGYRRLQSPYIGATFRRRFRRHICRCFFFHGSYRTPFPLRARGQWRHTCFAVFSPFFHYTLVRFPLPLSFFNVTSGGGRG